MIVEFAPAKINLTLNVTGRRDDGYHLIESLVVFADFGDLLHLQLSDAPLSLGYEGPFADALAREEPAWETLIRRAVQMTGCSASGGRILVDKHIPVAAGLGGGTADAAAVLRAAQTLSAVSRNTEQLAQIGLALGADVPACVHSEPLIMRGVGEKITRLQDWPDLPAVLVNARVPTETRAVFERYRAEGRPFSAPVFDQVSASSFEEALDVVGAGTNDLIEAAIATAPDAADTLNALSASPGARLVRMSGSGATCFALYETTAAAAAAAETLSSARSEWWVRACVLRGVRAPV